MEINGKDPYLGLSIIIPVYNVEKYIRSCVESIFRQGLDENCFEVIIVNDGTEDHSMEVIADIICQHHNISVINQENQGLSVARNNGIAAAKGEYILMPDSDDLLIEYSLKPLFIKAIESHADLVVADFLTMNDNEIENFTKSPSRPHSITTFIEKTGQQLILDDLIPHECYVWRTLYNRHFLINNHLKFYPGITYQDRPFTYACYLKANKCLKTSSFLYIYRKGHPTAASYLINKKKAFDYCISISEIWKASNIERLPISVRQTITTNIAKNIAALTRRTVREIKSRKERTEVIDYLNNVLPQLSFRYSTKQTILSYLRKHIPHIYMDILYVYANFYEDRFRPFIIHIFKNSNERY